MSTCLTRRRQNFVLPSHREFLYNALASADTDLVLAVLAALEQIGDKKALPFVEKLSERPVRTPRDAEIRRAAVQSIPLLLARAARHEVGSTLLRPAGEPAQPDRTLLRAAVDGGATDTEILVRPAASDPE